MHSSPTTPAATPQDGPAQGVPAQATRDPSSDSDWKPILTNFVIFQVCWFACVLSGAASMPFIGIAVVAAAVTFHLSRAVRPLPEAVLLVSAGLMGALWDGQLAGYGWLIYPSGEFAHWIAPSWIIAMWVSLGTTLNVSLRWLRGRPSVAVLFGAIGGPLAFYAGERLGGVEFSDPLVAFAALSVGWAIITPLLVFLATGLDGYSSVKTRQPETEAAQVSPHV
ncbi:MAG: DUF2878 domain-containing protein [Thiohalocapsa sp.]